MALGSFSEMWSGKTMANSVPVCTHAIWECLFMLALFLASFLFDIFIPWQVGSPTLDVFEFCSRSEFQRKKLYIVVLELTKSSTQTTYACWLLDVHLLLAKILLYQ